MEQPFIKMFESFFSSKEKNKGEVNIGNMDFSILPAQYSTLSGVEFVPGFFTQKDFTKQQMFKVIMDEIKKKDPFVYELLEYRPLSYSDGLFFQINTELLMLKIIQTFKK